MTGLTLYFVDAAPPGSSHGTLQVGGTAPSTATMGTGWVLGTTHASNEFADLAYGSVQPATAFTTTTGPTAGTGTNRCFVVGQGAGFAPLYGSFAAGTWTINIAAIMTAVASSGNATIRVRVYRGTNITGSGAQEVTQTTITTGNLNIASASQQNLSISWSSNPITLNSEYLFFELGCEIASGAVSSTGNTLKLVQDSTNSAITTPSFNANARTLYLLGTSQGTTGNPLGPDNSCDQVLAGGVWGQILPEFTTANTSSASGAVDPTTGIIYLFGDGDNDQGAQSYNPKTHAYAFLSNLPSNGWGQGTAVCINGICYIIGGLGLTGGSTTVYSWNIAGASFSTAFTPLAVGVNDARAVAVGNLVYHGGGDLGDGTGTPVNSWFRWEPISDTRTSLANMPVHLAGFAIAHLNGQIYCFGGYTTGDTNYQGNTGVYRYTIATDSWTTLGVLPIALNFAQACVFNDTIWIAGGITTTFGVYTANTYTYNVASDSYTAQGSLSTPIFGSVLGVAPGPDVYTQAIFTDQPTGRAPRVQTEITQKVTPPAAPTFQPASVFPDRGVVSASNAQSSFATSTPPPAQAPPPPTHFPRSHWT